MRRRFGSAAIGLAVASSVVLGYVINNLAHGITELLQHWWSTAPLLGLVLAAALGVAGLRSGQGRTR